MKNLLLILFVTASLVALYLVRKPGLDEYNRHVCAVYGYYEDCKTPLPISERIK